MAQKPFILTMGSSGVGKSSLLNALVADKEAFGVSKDAKAGEKEPRVVEKDHLKVMDSGGFADPDGKDAEIGMMLYEQFKRHGAPSAILLCSAGVRYDEMCQRVVGFLQRAFGDQALSRVIFVLTRLPLDDRGLKMHEKDAGREVPKQPDDKWRTATVLRWREELSTGLNKEMNDPKKHKWLGGTAAVPVLILDSHAKLFDDVADESEVTLFDDQVKFMLELSTKEPLRMLEALDNKLTDFLEAGVPQVVADILQDADKSKEGQETFFKRNSYLEFLQKKLEDEENGLSRRLCERLGAIVVQEIKDDMMRHGLTPEDLKRIKDAKLYNNCDETAFDTIVSFTTLGVGVAGAVAGGVVFSLLATLTVGGASQGLIWAAGAVAALEAAAAGGAMSGGAALFSAAACTGIGLGIFAGVAVLGGGIWAVTTAAWTRQGAIAEVQEQVCKKLDDPTQKLKENMRDAAMRLFFDYTRVAADVQAKLNSLSQDSG